MESLWILIPLSAGLVLLIIAVFGWAIHRGQFEDLEAEGERILTDDRPPVDPDQATPGG
jgi:cbb3-type cytochrome oxidase maturation protein